MTPLATRDSEPISSGEIQTVDPTRLEAVQRRHDQIREFLLHTSLDAVLLTDPATIAWFTIGSRLQLTGATQAGGRLFITRQARVVVCRDCDSGQFFDREVAGLGFQLKERPWQQPLRKLTDDLCRGRQVGCDDARGGSVDVSGELTALRRPDDPLEIVRLRQLSRELAHSVEATCRAFDQGETEAEIAGHVAHRLIRRSIRPVQIQVLADAQGHRYRQWNYGPDQVQRFATIKVTGERDGLHAMAARTVCFGKPPRAVAAAHEVASLVQATGMFFSQADWTASEVWKRVARIYEKLGAANEWRQAEQAAVVGYSPVERLMTPTAAFSLPPGTVMSWFPSVRAAMTGDTILVREEGFELLSLGDDWPMLSVVVKGHSVDRPAILVRDDSGRSIF